MTEKRSPKITIGMSGHGGNYEQAKVEAWMNFFYFLIDVQVNIRSIYGSAQIVHCRPGDRHRTNDLFFHAECLFPK
jgi:hypothetical protein